MHLKGNRGLTPCSFHSSSNKKENIWACEVAAIERTLQKTLFLKENFKRLCFLVLTVRRSQEDWQLTDIGSVITVLYKVLVLSHNCKFTGRH